MPRDSKTRAKPRARLDFHPACLLFPQLSDNELEDLAADIQRNGLLHAIVLCQGKILDGRNRYLACLKAGVEPQFVEWNGQGSPITWVISENLVRRHLTSSQRAVVALDLLPLLEKEARERRRFSRSSSAKKCADEATTGKASEVAARITRSNARYIEAVKAINYQAPELIDMIRSGELKVPDASELAMLPPGKRRTALQRRERVDVGGDITYGFRRGDYGTAPRESIVYTPSGLCQFLHDIISPTYSIRTILDPCAGKGALTRPWTGAQVIAFEISRGRDFLAHDGTIPCDIVLCNPPFNKDNADTREFLPEVFLRKIVDVVGPGARIVLFTPMGMRLNQHRRSRRWRWLRDQSPRITSVVSLPLDVFEGVEFHSEILFFNMPKLQPHYFLPDSYLPKHPKPRRARSPSA